jgi:hypothetical protein
MSRTAPCYCANRALAARDLRIVRSRIGDQTLQDS